MVDTETVADSARDSIDSLQKYGQQAAKAFERIANLARNADEQNWRNAIDEIFNIAYNNY